MSFLPLLLSSSEDTGTLGEHQRKTARARNARRLNEIVVKSDVRNFRTEDQPVVVCPRRSGKLVWGNLSLAEQRGGSETLEVK